ncbi:acyl carrier protein [Pseudoalteromonas xiamenensis]|uniref:acyl carrier protein n=1 Tax=Pseudoalteromonas xiamenensis TaxID=882626 RepID=UPI0035EEE9F4
MELKDKLEQSILTKIAVKFSSEVAQSVDKNDSLISQGLFDSMDFVGLLMELEAEHNVEIDFEDADPVQFTSINGLVALLSEFSNV